MKRYLSFGGDTYYPLGGWQDFQSSHETTREALREAANWGWDWFQIVDAETGEIAEDKKNK